MVFDKEFNIVSAMPGGETENSGSSGSGSSTSTSSVSVVLDVGSLEPFNPKVEPHGLSQRWKKWKRAFDLYVTGKGVTNDGQKRGLFLHVAGLDVQEIYFTLAGEDASASFAATVKVLDDSFIPKTNVPFERHLFRQIAQESGETVDQFVCRLRQRAASCEFGENEDDYIRDQVIDKCYSSKLRRKFLEKEGAATLEDLLRIARSQEAVDRQLKQYSADQLQASSQVNSQGQQEQGQVSDQINAVGAGKSDANAHSGNNNNNNHFIRAQKTCFSCGQEGHFSGDKKCPARDRVCRSCGGVGHFKVKCPRGHQRSAPESGSKAGRSRRGGGRGRARGRGRPPRRTLSQRVTV